MSRWTGKISGDVNGRGIWMRTGDVETIPTLWPRDSTTPAGTALNGDHDESDTQPLPDRFQRAALATAEPAVQVMSPGVLVDGDDDPTERKQPRIHTLQTNGSTRYDAGQPNRGRATQPPPPRRSAIRPRPSAIFDEGTSRPPSIHADEDTLTLEVDTGWHTHLTAGARPLHDVRVERSPDPRSTQVSGVHVDLPDETTHRAVQGNLDRDFAAGEFEPVPILVDGLHSPQGLQAMELFEDQSDDIDLTGLQTGTTEARSTPLMASNTLVTWLTSGLWFATGFVLFSSTAGAASALGAMLVYGALFLR